MRPGVVLLALLAAPAVAETPGDLRELVRTAISRLVVQGRASLEEHAYVQHMERTELLADGRRGRTQTMIFRREVVDGIMITRLVERDGRPVPEDEFRKRLAEEKAMSPAERERRRAERLKKEQEEESWLAELADAMEWRLAGEETVAGRLAWILDCSPRSGYSARNMRARVFAKTRGRILIDKADREMVRAEGETFDTVSIGFGFLAKIEKGTKFYFDRLRAGPETWLPNTRIIRFAARVMLFKNARNELTVRYADYKRQATTSITAGRR